MCALGKISGIPSIPHFVVERGHLGVACFVFNKPFWVTPIICMRWGVGQEAEGPALTWHDQPAGPVQRARRILASGGMVRGFASSHTVFSSLPCCPALLCPELTAKMGLFPPFLPYRRLSGDLEVGYRHSRACSWRHASDHPQYRAGNLSPSADWMWELQGGWSGHLLVLHFASPGVQSTHHVLLHE